jgi:hypothetical protein
MLKKLGNTKVVSDDGREIKIQFQWDYIVYKENKHALYIGIYRSSNQGKTFISLDATDAFTDWLPPHSEDPLPLKKKVEIINFLEECLVLLDYDFVINNKPVSKL